MTIALTLPTTLTLKDWADQIVLDLDRFGALSKLEDEVHWQDWALQFLMNIDVGLTLPDPYAFTDWRDWAERFCGSGM
jgi:hypothetical protein